MAEPPLEGAVQLTVACALPAVALTEDGKPGGVAHVLVSLRYVLPLRPPNRESLSLTPLYAKPAPARTVGVSAGLCRVQLEPSQVHVSPEYVELLTPPINTTVPVSAL